MIFRSAKQALEASVNGCEFALYNGDCHEMMELIEKGTIDMVVTSPPYFMGKSYDKSYDIKQFIDDHKRIAPLIVDSVRPGGTVAWQVGHHVKNGITTPLDFLVYNAFSDIPSLFLRNRIVWTFGSGLHATKRLSGRHETILWFTKGQEYYFNLDAVRVAQKYPGKRHYSGPKKGELSGNPLGKNPGDVWEIPNVKSNHVEKTAHPCQFPVALVERLVKGMCPSEGIVLDPFAGSGTTGLAAVLNGRRFIGAELDLDFCKIAEQRYQEFKNGNARVRPLERPLYEPKSTDSVARRPDHFHVR